MRDHVSRAARTIPPSGIRRFFDLVQTMDDVISLGVGEPDFSTPWKAIDACMVALEQGQTSYTSNRGMPALRERIADDLARDYGLCYDPETEMIITTGVSEGLDIAIRAVTDPGDEVLIAQPSYVSYAPCVTLAGGVPVPVPCLERDRFRLTAGQLMERVTPRTKALVINFPNNPTGAVMTASDLREVADVVEDHDLVLLSDEVYAELSYEQPHVPAATIGALRERTITLNGFSKAYAMTGWRIGYLCAPPALADAALKIHQYVMLCAPSMGQVAALAALRSARAEKDAMVEAYRLRRNLFVEGLNRAGLPCHLPEGAFYAFPSVAPTGLSDVAFAEQLLAEEHVAVVPGSVFGEGGAGHLRCAYAVSREDLVEAVNRIERFVSSLTDRPSQAVGVRQRAT
ncbi:MAG TPA: aminotransferase class I/II-fold pyridoxal phosphate-dependent enzyme [Methanoregulaceae archaeon]|nr:aminotransferase class I/II-fold pyridoxal phosphate-dependent enzyme [Methanoregulaceae archaeon]HOV66810.1 aminotransferase class I/II-fold pyridoxal phosphate-dependent enzyme [Methanoregulaceae archaeon]HQJ88641.1 aminotransferase class I/II-fold pyridoxal phosphate-dependent enzyme [Methanoregulaceae archaeon]